MSKATGITAVHLTGADVFERVAAIPGAFYYREWDGVPDAALVYSCPCGCGAIGTITVKPTPQYPSPWRNAGPDYEPTITPSIGFSGDHDAAKEADGYHWHGYLTAGIWESC